MSLLPFILLAGVILAGGLVYFLLQRRASAQTAGGEAPPRDDVSWLGRRNKPCILVTGLPGSGADSVLEPLWGLGVVGSSGDAGRPRWRVLGETLVCSVPEEVFAGEDHKAWDGVLRWLARRRATRPLDGVILTVPAILTGPAGLSPGEPVPARIRERLDRLRERLGFVVPIYVMVTGCENLAGFTALVGLLTQERREEMVGWSAGQRLDTAFSSEWVEEAFASIHEAVARTQLTLLGASNPPVAGDELLALTAGLAQLEKPLGRWLQPLFRPVASEDSHLLRGIYFCGAGAFVQHFWERKVLPEIRLARPAAGQTGTRSRLERAAQVMAVALAITLTAGTCWAYTRLAWVRDTHVRPLLDALAHANEGKAPGIARAFDFMATVDALEIQGFRSVFLPGSWNDRVDERIEKILSPAFQRLVVEVCRRELEQRMRMMPAGGAAAGAGPSTEAAPVPGPAEVSEGAGEPDDVVPDLAAHFTNDPNYVQLVAQIEQTTRLEENLRRYERLRDREAVGFAEVNRLLGYLSSEEVPRVAPRAKLERASLVEARVLTEAEWPPLTGRDKFGEHASRRTEELAAAFLGGWIGGGLLPAAIDRVSTRIENFEMGVDGGDAVFAELDQLIEETAAALDSGAWDWAAADFERNRWGVLGKALDHAPFASQVLVQSVETAGRQQHQLLAEQLRTAGRTSGGKVVELNGGKIRMVPAVRSLGAAVTHLRSFAALTQESASLRTLTPGAGYLWNVPELRQAAGVEAAYMQFSRETVATLPPRFQAAMRQIAGARARGAALARVARARTVNPVTSREGSDPERSLQPEIRSLTEAAEVFGEVAHMFDAMNAPGEREQLRRLLAQQANELLALTEREFDRMPIYRPLTGKAREATAGPLTLALYDARSKQEVRRFLDGERERIESFVKNYVLPLLGALDKLGVGTDRARTERWRTLTAGLKDYSTAKPGNSLRGLESFIEEGLDRIQPEGHCQVPPALAALAAPPASNDLFGAAERSIREQASSLCVAQLLGHYRQMADWFNTRLAGRYPFTAEARPEEKASVDPRDAERFFQGVDRYGAAIVALVSADPRFGEEGRRTVEFLGRAAALRPLFAIPEGEAGPVVGIAADFRSDSSREAAREVGSNQIMDWTLRVGDQVLTSNKAMPSIRWRHGDRTRMEFRYAKDSPSWPVPTPSGSVPLVDGRMVIFDLRHPWSLFQLLREYAASAADLTRGSQPAHWLRFRIPNQGSGPLPPPPSVLFMRVQLETLAGKKGNSVMVPTAFPDHAPALERPQGTRSAQR